MAITAFKTFISGEVLLASDLNSSFDVLVNEINTHGSEIDTINASPKGRAENMLVNGDFSVWQSGTSFLATGPTADLFRLEHDTTATTISREEFTLAQTDVPDNPKYYHRASVSLGTGASTYSRVEHEHEGVARVSGTGSTNEVTLSFWAKAGSVENLAVEFVQHFGTGGSPSADVTGIEVTTFNLTTSWQKFTKTFNMPSVSGKTLGDYGDSLKILFWHDAGSDFDSRTNSLGHQGGIFDMANIQLEFGSEATEFEYVPPAIQKSRAQQYFNPSVQGQKNLIINGDFSVWQRGTGAFTADGYTADRWRVNQSGATTSTSQGVFALGQTDVPMNPKFYLDHNVTASSDFSTLQHRLEDVQTTSDQEVTLSFYAKGVDPSGGLVLRVQQNFGTGGSPSSTVTAETQTLTSLTSSWQKYVVTFVLPSVTGKTLGTNNDDYLHILLGQNTDTATDAWNIDISNVQLEFGDRATGFEYVSPADQLARCQRYHVDLLGGDYAGGKGIMNVTAWTTTDVFGVYHLPTQMRDIPTLSISAAGDFFPLIGGVSNAFSVLNLQNASCISAELFGTTTGITLGHSGWMRSLNTSARISLSAEL